MSFVLNRQKL